MNKQDFLNQLKEELKMYPVEETSKSIEYYDEAIEDRVEDGMTEAEAVASLGPVEEIVNQIKGELPLKTIVKEKTGGMNLPAWAIVLIILGLPIWISVAAVIISLYISIWAVVFSLGCVALSFAAVSLFSFVFIWLRLFSGNMLDAFFTLGLTLISASLAILFGLLTFLAGKGLVLGTKQCVKQIKMEISGKKETEKK